MAFGSTAVERALAEATARAYALAGASDPLTKQETIKPGLSLKAYRVLTRLAAPFAPLILAWRTRRGKEEPDRRPERYGLASAPRPPGFLAWFHAASVGEANAALPVIETIAAERPEIRMLLTTATVTSARLARARLPRGVLHQYVPLDNPVLRAALLAPLASRSRRAGRIGDLAESRARDQGARHSAAPHQRPHVDILLQALAETAGLEPAAVLGLRSRARAERQPRRALRPARRRPRARRGQPQGRRAAAAVPICPDGASSTRRFQAARCGSPPAPIQARTRP